LINTSKNLKKVNFLKNQMFTICVINQKKYLSKKETSKE